MRRVGSDELGRAGVRQFVTRESWALTWTSLEAVEYFVSTSGRDRGAGLMQGRRERVHSR